MGNFFEAGLRFKSDSRELKTATKDLKGVQREAKRTERAASALGRTFGRALAGIGAGLVFRQIIRATVEQERSIAQLNAALRSTGRYSKETSKALRDQAKALQSVTTFGDEAVLGAQNVLLTFRAIGDDAFPRATESTLDLATAMGTDLKSAAIQVGKALQDPATQMSYLARSGITFSEAQKKAAKEMQKAGDIAGAQAIVLKELETQFGGSARAARDTFGGALAAVGNAMSDLLEGDTGSLTGTVTALNDLEAILADPDIQEGFQRMAAGAASFLGYAAQIPGVVAFLSDEFKAMVSGPEFDDFERRAAEIAQLQDLLRQREADPDDDGILANLLFGESEEELRARVKKLIDDLQTDIRNAENITAKGGDPFDDKLGKGKGGLDDPLAPVTVSAEPKLAEAAKLARQNAKAMREIGEEAAQGLEDTFLALAASIGGEPIAALNEYTEKLAELTDYEDRLRASGQLTAEQEQVLADARALANAEYEKRIELHNKELEVEAAKLSQSEEVLEQLRLEGELIGLSNLEREKRIALQLAGKDATDAETAAILEQVEANNKAREAAAYMNDLKDAGTDALASFLDGTNSAKDAFKSFADDLIKQAARILAQKAIAAIFGGGGGFSGGGDAGGAFGTILSSIFGSGRALGGPVYPGRLHEVNERGAPELLTVGAKQYLMTGAQQGKVEPISKTTNNNRTTSVVVNLPPEMRRRTAQQVAQEVSREQRRVEVRNR